MLAIELEVVNRIESDHAAARKCSCFQQMQLVFPSDIEFEGSHRVDDDAAGADGRRGRKLSTDNGIARKADTSVEAAAVYKKTYKANYTRAAEAAKKAIQRKLLEVMDRSDSAGIFRIDSLPGSSQGEQSVELAMSAIAREFSRSGSQGPAPSRDQQRGIAIFCFTSVRRSLRSPQSVENERTRRRKDRLIFVISPDHRRRCACSQNVSLCAEITNKA